MRWRDGVLTWFAALFKKAAFCCKNIRMWRNLLETRTMSCMIHLQSTGLGWCTCRCALWACGRGTCSAGIRRDPRRADTGQWCSSACRSVDHSRDFRHTRQTLILRWSRSSLLVWRWVRQYVQCWRMRALSDDSRCSTYLFNQYDADVNITSNIWRTHNAWYQS